MTAVYGDGHSDTSHDPESRLGTSAFDLVVIAASYGGIEACGTLLSRLPSDFPACVIVAQHLPPESDARFRFSLDRRCALPVTLAVEGTPVAPGVVYIAPAAEQLLVTRERTLTLAPPAPAAGPRLGRLRCLADPLFESAAASFGPNMIAVVLTGRLQDGSQGVRAVKAKGGRVLVQDPATAVAPDMPMASLATGCCDFALPPDKIADAVTTLVMAPGAAEVFRVPVSPWAARPMMA